MYFFNHYCLLFISYITYYFCLIFYLHIFILHLTFFQQPTAEQFKINDRDDGISILINNNFHTKLNGKIYSSNSLFTSTLVTLLLNQAYYKIILTLPYCAFHYNMSTRFFVSYIRVISSLLTIALDFNFILVLCFTLISLSFIREYYVDNLPRSIISNL